MVLPSLSCPQTPGAGGSGSRGSRGGAGPVGVGAARGGAGPEEGRGRGYDSLAQSAAGHWRGVASGLRAAYKKRRIGCQDPLHPSAARVSSLSAVSAPPLPLPLPPTPRGRRQLHSGDSARWWLEPCKGKCDFLLCKLRSAPTVSEEPEVTRADALRVYCVWTLS